MTERHAAMHELDGELAAAMHHLANCARNVLVLGLKGELVEAIESMERLHAKVAAMHLKATTC